MYLTLDEIVCDVLLYKLTETAKQELRRLEYDDLIQLHRTFGRDIRNEYKLWDENNPLTMKNYQAVVVDNVDVNPKHPDSVSMQIIRQVWRKLQ